MGSTIARTDDRTTAPIDRGRRVRCWWNEPRLRDLPANIVLSTCAFANGPVLCWQRCRRQHFSAAAPVGRADRCDGTGADHTGPRMRRFRGRRRSLATIACLRTWPLLTGSIAITASAARSLAHPLTHRQISWPRMTMRHPLCFRSVRLRNLKAGCRRHARYSCCFTCPMSQQGSRTIRETRRAALSGQVSSGVGRRPGGGARLRDVRLSAPTRASVRVCSMLPGGGPFGLDTGPPPCWPANSPEWVQGVAPWPIW